MSSRASVDSLINEVERFLPKIKGVIHAAGVLKDGAFDSLSKEDYQKVFAPKVMGAIHLHKALLGSNLNNFVLFSSAASIFGTPGQANYAAANAFLDQLAIYRKRQGLEAVSINWGSIAEIGMAAADVKRGERLEKQGITSLKPKELPAYIDFATSIDTAQAIVVKVDFNKWVQNNPTYLKNEMLADFIDLSGEDKLLQKVIGASNYNSALKMLKEVMKEIVSETTKAPKETIKEDVTLKNLGIDSLMAVQIKNKLQYELDLNIPVSSLWTYPTVEKYAAFLSEELSLREKFDSEQIENADVASKTNAAEKEVEDLSLDDLMKELEDKSNEY